MESLPGKSPLDPSRLNNIPTKTKIGCGCLSVILIMIIISLIVAGVSEDDDNQKPKYTPSVQETVWNNTFLASLNQIDVATKQYKQYGLLADLHDPRWQQAMIDSMSPIHRAYQNMTSLEIPKTDIAYYSNILRLLGDLDMAAYSIDDAVAKENGVLLLSAAEDFMYASNALANPKNWIVEPSPSVGVAN